MKEHKPDCKTSIDQTCDRCAGLTPVTGISEQVRAKDAYIRELLDDIELLNDPDTMMITRDMIEHSCKEVGIGENLSRYLCDAIFGGVNNANITK